MNTPESQRVVVHVSDKPSLVAICRAVLLHPQAFFQNLQLDTPLDESLKFLAVILAISSLGHLFDGGITGYIGAFVGNAATQVVFAVALTFMAKVFGGTRDFSNMLRACCYASVPLLLHLLPLVGLLGNIYGLYLLFLGVQRTQQLDKKKSLFTVLSACVCCIAVSAIWHGLFHGHHR
jgi:hypothetical protein